MRGMIRQGAGGVVEDEGLWDGWWVKLCEDEMGEMV
jgi:hypothetical protein